jgi:hypothetical protein
MELQSDLFSQEDAARARMLAAVAAAAAQPPHHHNAPDTAQAGAVAAAGRAPAQAVRVLLYLARRTQTHGGATDWEGATALDLLKSSYTARRRALEKLHLVEDSGSRANSRFGTKNAIYRATAPALAALQ